MISIVWFRQDLRIRDNPALAAASARGPILPIYILDDDTARSKWPLGGASRWWLHQSLGALREALGQLTVFKGDPKRLVPELAKKLGASAVYWNRCYEPSAIARDTSVKETLKGSGVEAHSFNGSLLHEPWEIETGSGTPFKVFTPYWRASQSKPVQPPLPPATFTLAEANVPAAKVTDLHLLPKRPDWAADWKTHWEPGEAGALARFDEFVENDLTKYSDARDRPDLPGTSRLSPHLHWGEISPRQIWSRLALEAEEPSKRAGVTKFMSEIGWREFSYHLLYHFPALPEQNWRPAFDNYPWQKDVVALRAWQKGQTGYPIVDAGMRQLWQTGWMHNRVRMITASFLVKHLRTDWRQGEDWFWDTLVDANLANNAASWQWIAGSGADASPYFRIFNPVTQGEKFDPKGDYVSRWCPELARLPSTNIHQPFNATQETLSKAGVKLGQTYPYPIVDLGQARKSALEAYSTIRGG